MKTTCRRSPAQIRTLRGPTRRFALRKGYRAVAVATLVAIRSGPCRRRPHAEGQEMPKSLKGRPKGATVQEEPEVYPSLHAHSEERNATWGSWRRPCASRT